VNCAEERKLKEKLGYGRGKRRINKWIVGK
jgi:hypothetical protein